MNKYKYVKLLLPALLLCLGWSFLRPHAVRAGGIHDQVVWYAPDSIAWDVENRCINYGWSVVQEQWISARGAPTSTTATVAYGSTSAPLQLNYLTYRCNNGSLIVSGSFQITGTAGSFFFGNTPNIPQLNGTVGDMPYGSVGEVRSGNIRNFDYPTGVATSSHDILVGFESRGTITPLFAPSTCAIWNAGDYSGQTPGGDPHNFDWCARGWSFFWIHLDVLPPPANTPTATVSCNAGNPQSATISWTGGQPASWWFGTGFIVDISTDPSFGGFWNRFVQDPARSTTVPEGSNWAPQGSASGALTSLSVGTKYYIRVWNGTESGTGNFTFRCPPQPSCSGVTTNPANIEPNQGFDMRVNISNGSGAGTLSKNSFPMKVTITGSSYTDINLSYPDIVSGSTGSSSWLNGISLPAGTYTVRIDFTGVSGGPFSCPGSLSVAFRPYLRVYGGDIFAGGTIGQSCTPTTNSGIVGYNTDTPSWGGGGVQFGQSATASVYQFTSAALRFTEPPPNPANGLSFANTGAGVNGTWGGTFGSAPCQSDYSTVQEVNAPAGNSFGGITVGPNGRYVIKRVNQNVIISNNICFGACSSDPSWANANEVPSFYLVVVGGNIYIDKGVSQLDGVFIAQPKSGTGGTIYTCAENTSAVPRARLLNDCGTKLTVNGALVANQVKFLRTKGTLNDAPKGTPATGGGLAWSSWKNLNSSCTGVGGYQPSASGYSPGVASMTSNNLDVFYVGSDSKLKHCYSNDSGNNWTPGNLGSPSGINLTSSPSAVSWSNGRIDVFVRGSDNALWHTYYNSGWSGAWDNWGGCLTSGPASASWASGRLDVAVVGCPNGGFHGAWQGGWSGFVNNLGGSFSSDLTAVSWGANRLDLFGRGGGNLIYHNYWAGGFSGWLQEIAGCAGGAPAATAPGMSSSSGNRLDVFVIGCGSPPGLYQSTWTPSTGWSPFNLIDGSTGPTSKLAAVSRGAPSSGQSYFDIFSFNSSRQLIWKNYDNQPVVPGTPATPEPKTSGSIAEVINYTPEIWIAPGPFGQGTLDTQSITSLPPVL